MMKHVALMILGLSSLSLLAEEAAPAVKAPVAASVAVPAPAVPAVAAKPAAAVHDANCPLHSATGVAAKPAAPRPPMDTAAIAKKMIQAFDKDADGKLDETELGELLKSVPALNAQTPRSSPAMPGKAIGNGLPPAASGVQTVPPTSPVAVPVAVPQLSKEPAAPAPVPLVVKSPTVAATPGVPDSASIHANHAQTMANSASPAAAQSTAPATPPAMNTTVIAKKLIQKFDKDADSKMNEAELAELLKAVPVIMGASRPHGTPVIRSGTASPAGAAPHGATINVQRGIPSPLPPAAGPEKAAPSPRPAK
jgi:hypothetical protein